MDLVFKMVKKLKDNWIYFEQNLGHFSASFFLAVIFFVVFVPVGLVRRLLSKTIVSKKIGRHQNSFWTECLSGQTNFEEQH